jgi:hypothetical protein
MVKITTSPAPGHGRGPARPAVSPALLAALAGRITATPGTGGCCACS